MKPHSSQTRLQQNQESTEIQNQQQHQVTQFESAEELLKHDAAQITPPPAIMARLRESLAKEPPKKSRSWWQRLFS
jgi:hypothetical protein